MSELTDVGAGYENNGGPVRAAGNYFSNSEAAKAYKPLLEADRRYNNDPKQSALSCGCDPGANHQCLSHRTGVWPVRQRPGQSGVEQGQERIQQAVCAGPFSDARDCPVHKPSLAVRSAPTRATTLPDEPTERKKFPLASGVLDYFPDALLAVAQVSWQGNEQHNLGMPLHWDRSKSADEADTMQRHFMQRGTRDKDGTRHSAKMAWRALALLQKEIESETGA